MVEPIVSTGVGGFFGRGGFEDKEGTVLHPLAVFRRGGVGAGEGVEDGEVGGSGGAVTGGVGAGFFVDVDGFCNGVGERNVVNLNSQMTQYRIGK